MHTGSTAHHALQPRHDPHAMEKEKFARFVAQQINAVSAADAFDALLLVAPPHSLDAIRSALNTTAEAKIIGTLAKDLVKTADNELLPHIEAWLPPVVTS
jgi:protein required for attachment to host cells